jgi:hypothetical protein
VRILAGTIFEEKFLGQKQIKRARRALRSITEILGPIIPSVLEELGGDENLLMQWAAIALFLKETTPAIPLHELLPSVLPRTIEKYRTDFGQLCFQKRGLKVYPFAKIDPIEGQP